MSAVTQVLNAISEGDAAASEELLPLVYQELRALAASRMNREKPGDTLQATALVHEVWLRLAGSDRQAWNGKEHFFAAAAESMRRILVDRARRKLAIKHGGDQQRVDVADIDLPIAEDDSKCVLVSQLLEELGEEEPEKAEIVKYRVFVGLSMTEIASLRRCSEKTIQRHWVYAKAWLTVRLEKELRAVN